MESRVELMAPLSGVMVPIETVPDPVFARKMVGEGFSIDPFTSELLAPIAGEVADIQPSAHAITIRSAQGLEVLLHIGLDTVKMEGSGFIPRVTLGTQVAVGDPLISFDMDLVATNAKSVLTQVVIANSELVANLTPSTGVVTAGRDVAAYVDLAQPAVGSDGAPSAGAGTQATSGAILIPNPTGLHARPAATLVNLAKGFTSDIRLRRGEDVANAKSIMAIMSLAVARGDKVTVTAHGADADEAVAALVAAIRSGLGEDVTGFQGSDDTTAMPAVPGAVQGAPEAAAATAALTASTGEIARPRSGDPNLLLGVSASPGLGIGTVIQVRHNDIDVAEFADDHHKERRKLNAAIERADADADAMRQGHAPINQHHRHPIRPKPARPPRQRSTRQEKR